MPNVDEIFMEKIVESKQFVHLNKNTSMNPKNILLIAFLISNLLLFGQTDTQKFSNISIDKFGNIKWTVSYLNVGQSFEILIEQLKDGKWIHKSGIGGSILFASELNSESSNSSSSKEPKVYEGSSKVKFHKGINIYRLRMTYPTQITSEEFQLNSSVSNDDGSLWIMDDVIYLDNVEQYEILDKVGATILKNESKTIDISKLPTGHYFLYTKKATIPFDK